MELNLVCIPSLLCLVSHDYPYFSEILEGVPEVHDLITIMYSGSSCMHIFLMFSKKYIRDKCQEEY